MSEREWKILVLERDPAAVNRLETAFEGQGYTHRTCADWDSAVKTIELWNPDAVLCETDFADRDRVWLTREFRAMPAMRDAMLVMMHPAGEVSGQGDLVDSGVNDLLPRDISIGELIRRLGNLLELKLARMELAWAQVLLREEKKLLGRYFSEEIVEQILKDDRGQALQGANIEASILFFDIRKSTAIAESLDPNIFAEFLSEFFTDIMDLVYGNRGSVNKLLGDGIMATFGCPLPSEKDALNAVRCAAQIRDHLATFNDVRPDYLIEPLRAGIGIASGKVFAGNIGSVRRREYTVLGDPVNTASRLESLTKEVGADILIDGRTRHMLGNLIKVEKAEVTHVRGRLAEMEIFKLISVP